MENFSEKLKKLLKSNKMTKGELCTRVGISLNGIKHMEDNNKLKLDTLDKICSVLSVDRDYFLKDNFVVGAGKNEMYKDDIYKDDTYKDYLIETLSKEKLEYQKKLFRALEFIKSHGLNFLLVSRKASCWDSNFFFGAITNNSTNICSF